jgi:hypothetical protein
MLSITALLEVLNKDNEGVDIGTFAGAIPLSEAVLCVDCETVTQRIREGRCSHCGSHSVMHLSVALQGPKAVELPPSGIEMTFGEVTRPAPDEAKLPSGLTGTLN